MMKSYFLTWYTLRGNVINDLTRTVDNTIVAHHGKPLKSWTDSKQFWAYSTGLLSERLLNQPACVSSADTHIEWMENWRLWGMKIYCLWPCIAWYKYDGFKTDNFINWQHLWLHKDNIMITFYALFNFWVTEYCNQQWILHTKLLHWL